MGCWDPLCCWSAKCLAQLPYLCPGFKMGMRLLVEKNMKSHSWIMFVLWNWMPWMSQIQGHIHVWQPTWLDLMNAVPSWLYKVSGRILPHLLQNSSFFFSFFSLVSHGLFFMVCLVWVFFPGFLFFFFWLKTAHFLPHGDPPINIFLPLSLLCLILRTTFFCEDTWSPGSFAWIKCDIHQLHQGQYSLQSDLVPRHQGAGARQQLLNLSQWVCGTAAAVQCGARPQRGLCLCGHKWCWQCLVYNTALCERCVWVCAWMHSYLHSLSACSSSTSIPLTIDLYLPTEPAVFVKKLSDFSVEQGKSIVLESSYIGTPPISVTWKRNGMPIAQSQRCTVTTTEKSGILEIFNSTKNDEGEYICEVANEAGGDVCHSLVSILGIQHPWSP